MPTSYSFVEIANTDGIFSEFSEAPAIDESGIVVWTALLGGSKSGIFLGTGIGSPASPVTIASTDQNFTGFGFPTINDSGQVTFFAESGVESGIYLTSSILSQPTTLAIAQKNQAAPGTNGALKFTSFSPDPAINNAGDVAFLAGLTGGNSGLYVGDGQSSPQRIADTVGIFSGLNFADFLGYGFDGDVAPAINDSGEIAFWGLLDDRLRRGSPEYNQIPEGDRAGNVRGIYLATDSGIQTIADNRGAYLSFSGSPSINEDGDVAYIFRGDGLNNVRTPFRGINIYQNGRTKTIIDNNDTDKITGVDKFYRFGFVGLNDQDEIAFSALFDADLSAANGPPTLGIFTANAGGNVSKVIAVGDRIAGIGATVTDLVFFTKGFNDAGQIAFSATFDNGTQGIFRADPQGIQAIG